MESGSFDTRQSELNFVHAVFNKRPFSTGFQRGYRIKPSTFIFFPERYYGLAVICHHYVFISTGCIRNKYAIRYEDVPMQYCKTK